MKVTLKNAIYLFTKDNIEMNDFKYYLKKAIRETDNSQLILKEGDVIEFTYNNTQVVFTWENISAINLTTGVYCDLMHLDNVREVFEY